MALAMTRPWKHPKTGVYWLRKRVPADLVPVLGRREEKQSLRTKDPAEAKRSLVAALSALEARWANLRQGPQTLTEREAHQRALVVHDSWLARHRDNPSDQTFWPAHLGDGVFAPPPTTREPFDPDMLYRIDPQLLKVKELEAWCLAQADEGLTALGLVVDEDGRRKFARAIAQAMQRASVTLAQMSRGEFVLDRAPMPTRAPDLPLPSRASTGEAAIPLPFEQLVEGWAAEKRPVAKTVYEWSRVVRQLAAFLGHDDASRVTPDDLLAWKASMIAAGLKPKTIRDAKLAPVRTILQWAADNRRLPTNPAERLTVTMKAKAGEGRRSFTDDEAKIILRAALGERDPVRRWVPWLCCYSGARLSEVCQLRREDILQVEGIWCMRFTPDAGSLKTAGSERAVPLHPALVESGFLTFVETVASGPLFSGLPPDKFGKRGGNGTKVLGRWVRSLGLVDERLSPNHSWRHRLKTLGRRHGLAPDIVDAITGHQRRTVADTYGEFEMSSLYRELIKIPTLLVSNDE